MKKLLPLLAIFFLALFLFGNTLFPPVRKMIYGGDIYDAYFFWKNYLAESIKSGVIPFWNPYNFSGTPFLAHPNVNIFYPLNWLFIVMPPNLSFAWYFFIHIVIAGVNMYWLSRQFTDRWGAFLSAVTYALGGFFAARVYSGHLEYVDAASWMPLVFGLTRKAMISPTSRNILFSGLGMGILLLVGNELFFLFILELLGLYAIYLLFVQGFLRARFNLIIKVVTYIKVGMLSFLIGFGIAAIELLPRYQFMSLSLRSLGIPYELAGSGSLPLSGLLLFLNPFYWGKPFLDNYSYHGPWPNLFEFTHYVGILPVFILFFFLLFFLLSKIIKKIQIPKIKNELWFFILLVIPLFLLISFGNQIPVNFHKILWNDLSFYKSIRFPARHLFMVAFSLSIVSGIIVGVLRNKFFKTLLIGFVVFDLLLFDKNFFRLSDVPTETFDKQLISIFAKDPGLYRLLPDFSVVSAVRRDMDFGAASMYQIQTASDYNSMILWRYYHFIDLLNNSKSSSIPYFNVEIPPPDPTSPLIDFLNIKYVLSDKLFDRIADRDLSKYRLVKDGANYKLYENISYLPRFFLVGNAKVYSSVQAVEENLLQNPSDTTKTVLLVDSDLEKGKDYDLNCLAEPRGIVEVASYTANRIILNTKSSCNNFLSSSEVYYPGWKARIDEIDTKIYLSNFSFRSIYVPKGDHVIEFYYKPDVFYLGGAITLVASSIVIFFIIKLKNEK
jgi:hypothetical protein